jgi:hypothetical protein
MSEQQAITQAMHVLKGFPQGLKDLLVTFGTAYAMGRRDGQAEPQAPAETKDQNDNPTA